MTNLFLVTGSIGFVGKQIVKILHARGYKIRAVVRKGVDLSDFNGMNITIIESNDIFEENENWWRNALRGVDYVIHAAWYVNPADYLTSYKNIDSLLGTIKIAKAAADENVKKFIGIGTCFEYRESNEDLDNFSSLEPNTLYAASKVSVYYILTQFFKATQTKFLWCRLFYLYGEGEKNQRLVPHIINNLSENKIVELSSGEQIKDYMDVKIAANDIVNASTGSFIGAFNICSGIGVSIYDLAMSIAGRVNKSHLIKVGVKGKKVSDPQRVVGKKSI
jgi:dTDP-6-deoxy-L-talose 4-dehydrogenase (NAD+)